MTAETNQMGAKETTRPFIIDELRRTHAHQLHLLDEIDDKAETVMRLAVFAVTGVAVFLTYAARPDSSIDFASLETTLLLLGVLFQLLSFYAVLKSYGVLGSPRVLDVGVDFASRRSLENRDDEELCELVAASYRKAIKTAAQAYAGTSQELGFATLTLSWAR